MSLTFNLAHLGPGVDAVELGAGAGVPEADGAVGGAAAGRQQVALEGAPGQRLHRRLVARQRVHWRRLRRGNTVQTVRDMLVVTNEGDMSASGWMRCNRGDEDALGHRVTTEDAQLCASHSAGQRHGQAEFLATHRALQLLL